MIKVTDLHFSYTPQTEILSGLNLELGGASTAIIGQNGSGKTTFVKLLKGLLKPTVGTVAVLGTDTRAATVAQLAAKIGLIFQNPNDQIFKNNVLAEVMFGPLNIGFTPQKAQESAEQALEMVGLREKTAENPYDLSLSERKMISIASVVAMDTPVIIFDEPTIAQDFQGRERIKDIILSLRQAGKLVLTIIHDMDFVAEAFERVIVFKQGDVLLDGSPREVFSQPQLLHSAYLEPPHVTQLCQKLEWPALLTVDEFTNDKRILTTGSRR